MEGAILEEDKRMLREISTLEIRKTKLEVERKELIASLAERNAANVKDEEKRLAAAISLQKDLEESLRQKYDERLELEEELASIGPIEEELSRLMEEKSSLVLQKSQIASNLLKLSEEEANVSKAIERLQSAMQL